jgi:uncharacterized protein
MKKEEIKLWDETFAVVKSKREYPGAFANIKDKKELTVIIEQDKIKKEDIIQIEKDWRLITFDMVLEFNLVGFIAKISNALAKEGISIFVVSSYSTDHLMVKEKDLEKTLEVLENLEVKTK